MQFTPGPLGRPLPGPGGDLRRRHRVGSWAPV